MNETKKNNKGSDVKMKILVDGDGCPVKEYIEAIARKNSIEVEIYIDTSHIFESDYSKVITVSKGADSVDFALIQSAAKGDVVVTSDYGVATMALANGCHCCNFYGQLYTNENIDQLLFMRHLSKKMRKAGQRTKHIKKRTTTDNQTFEEGFTKLIKNLLNKKE